MQLTLSLLVAAASIAPVLAFDGSAPFIIAQGQGSAGRSMSPLNPATSLEAAIESIPCADVTLIFDQPKVHASDLSRFSKNFAAIKELATEGSSIIVPYARGENAVEAIVSRIQQHCNINSQAKAVDVNDILSLDVSRIYVTKLASFSGNIETQQKVATLNEKIMNSLIPKAKALSTSHVIIFTSSNIESRGIQRRTDTPISTKNSTFVPFNNRTFIQKYVLFNMGVFEGSISLFLVCFISLIGVNILRSVQTPTKFEEPARK
ncbi:hypothetical protein BCR33DRAFT_721105 [Rhizoclosmatium globosum]|uniref:Protein BIG1 n=1 Tax=Rhizoclosmatium globosum TaxID=329046 RepID=A0A1Y2BT10_9FUNG|nr:hypothetical protein BCR33DRAFT_721105 [Rhizoclosmatium globosum]|eukprot:ORY37902.1 hypothetical protein BCR33DRAFT_721105 [Rhizoclosmatium globosum]